jgi:hypothetical protein
MEETSLRDVDIDGRDQHDIDVDEREISRGIAIGGRERHMRKIDAST